MTFSRRIIFWCQRTPAILISMVILGACARLPAPLPAKHSAPQTAIHATLTQDAKQDDLIRGGWPKKDWWKTANAPALNRLIHTALDSNPNLKMAAARILQAKADAERAHAALLPHLSAGTAITQEHFSQQGLHALLNGKTVTYGALNPIMIRYHLDLWGKDLDRVRAALGAVRVHEADYAQVRLLLSTEITWHYFLLSGLTAQYQLVNERLKLERALLRLEQRRWRDGLSNASAVYTQQETCAAVGQKRAQLQAAIAEQRYLLAALAGQGPDWGASIQSTPLPVLPTFALPADLPLQLLARRPDIVAARWETALAAQEVKAARAAFYPNVNLHFFVGWNSINLGDLLSIGNLAHAVGPVISLPIFEGGALRAGLKAQNAVFQASNDHYQATILDAVREVVDQLREWQQVHQQIKEQKMMMVSAKQASRLAETAYRNGLSNKAAFYKAQIQQISVEEQATSLYTQNAQAWAKLNGALGGGYRTRNKPA